MNRSIFKAYDIRGRYPEEINEAAVREIAGAIAGKLGSGRIVLARDARSSSPALYEAAKEALKAAVPDSEVVEVGMATTPMFYFLVNDLQAVGGIMITASHNPKEFNGLKMVRKKGEAISGEEVLSWII